MAEYLIEGETVAASPHHGGRRIWRCTCQDFERRLVRYGEGFCEHVVLAISGEHGQRHTLADFPTDAPSFMGPEE
jgi:hypothetical protein